MSTLNVDRILPQFTNKVNIPGHAIQTLHATQPGTWSAATSGNNYYDVTGLQLDITPISNTSKILVFVNLYCSSSSQAYHQKYRISRNGVFPILGNPEGSRPVATGMVNGYNNSGSDWQYNVMQLSGVHLDSPNTTTQLTYKVQMASYDGSTIYLNRSHTWQNSPASGYDAVPVSTLTIMEIAQ